MSKQPFSLQLAGPPPSPIAALSVVLQRHCDVLLKPGLGRRGRAGGLVSEFDIACDIDSAVWVAGV